MIVITSTLTLSVRQFLQIKTGVLLDTAMCVYLHVVDNIVYGILNEQKFSAQQLSV